MDSQRGKWLWKLVVLAEIRQSDCAQQPIKQEENVVSVFLPHGKIEHHDFHLLIWNSVAVQSPWTGRFWGFNRSREFDCTSLEGENVRNVRYGKIESGKQGVRTNLRHDSTALCDNALRKLVWTTFLN